MIEFPHINCSIKFALCINLVIAAMLQYFKLKLTTARDYELRQYPIHVSKSAIHDPSFHFIGNPVIPFYIYNETSFQWIENCTKNAENPYIKIYNKTHPKPSLEAHLTKQHGNDIRFIKQLSNHPWRTYDPHRAEMFVIPVLLNFMTERSKTGENETLTFTTTCDSRNLTEMLKITTKALHETEFFFGFPEKHIIVASTFYIPNAMNPGGFSRSARLTIPFKKILKQIIVGNFEDFPKMVYRSRDKYDSKNMTKSNFRWSQRFSKCNIIVPYHNMLEPVVSVEKWSYRDNRLTGVFFNSAETF